MVFSVGVSMVKKTEGLCPPGTFVPVGGPRGIELSKVRGRQGALCHIEYVGRPSLRRRYMNRV